MGEVRRSTAGRWWRVRHACVLWARGAQAPRAHRGPSSPLLTTDRGGEGRRAAGSGGDDLPLLLTPRPVRLLLDGGSVGGARITRKTLLGLPNPQPSASPAPKLPDHPAYQQILAVFAAADAPLRARQVYEAMGLEIAPNNINNTYL